MSLTKTTYSMIKGAEANVLDFGAYNDGTNATATTAAIQAALDSGAASVFLPQGNYLVNDTLAIPTFVTLFGEAADVNQYTKATSGSVLVADTGAFASSSSVIQIGTPSTELSSVGVMSLVVDIRNADSTAIGIRKESCNHFKMTDVWVMGSFSSSSQICYFNGNGTHGYFENIKLYGGKQSCRMDNTTSRECHDSVYNKVWMYPHAQTDAVCLYFNGDGVGGGNANTTWIMPYFETDGSGLTTGVLNENLTSPNMTMLYPTWDGTFLYYWNAGYPNRSKLIGTNLSDFDTGFNGSFARNTLIGRQGSQLIEKLYLMDAGGEAQFGIDSTGFNFGRISNGAAKITRIQGGVATSEVVGTVAAGDSFQVDVSTSNIDAGDPVIAGINWTGTTPIQLTAHKTTSGICRVTLTNHHTSSVDFGTCDFKVIGFNGSIV